MKSLIAFTKKEFLEGFRSNRIYIITALFVLLAIMSPAFAKLMPKILEMAITDNMNITINDPTALDSWQQFFKNVGQIGLIVLVIMYSSMLSSEIVKGTLINLVTKGLNRVTILASKFIAAFVSWTFVYWISFLISYAYTVYYWSNDNVNHLLLMAAALWLFGIMLLALILFTSTLIAGTYGALLGTGAVVAAMLLLQVIPNVNKFNPIRLVSDNYAVVSGAMEVGDLTRPMIVTIIIIVASLLLSVICFHKKRL